jgi:hypothetical protein
MLKKPTIILIVLSLVSILILAVPQSALAVPGQCPSGYTYIAKFNWQNSWVPEPGDPPGVVTVTGDAQTGSWTSLVDIGVMVVSDGKTGGPGGGEPIFVEIYYPIRPTYSGTYDASDMLPPQNPPRDISNLVFCGQAYPVTLASFTTRANRGTVTIDWVTATEVNTVGFYLYRSATENGPQMQVNANLIAAQGDGVTGGSYRLTDAPGYGTFYYWLVDVDYSGQTSLHGPVVVKVLPAIRQPVSLPSLPGQ